MLVQTGIDTKNRPVIYVREVEKEGLNKEAQQLLHSDLVHENKAVRNDEAHAITIHLQENILHGNEEE